MIEEIELLKEDASVPPHEVVAEDPTGPENVLTNNIQPAPELRQGALALVAQLAFVYSVLGENSWDIGNLIVLGETTPELELETVSAPPTIQHSHGPEGAHAEEAGGPIRAVIGRQIPRKTERRALVDGLDDAGRVGDVGVSGNSSEIRALAEGLHGVLESVGHELLVRQASREDLASAAPQRPPKAVSGPLIRLGSKADVERAFIPS
jgi:hypothetical protein